MPDGTQRPAVRRGRKYDQVIAGARDVFMADGFERASVDDIAKRAGVSKATLYSYFPDKRLLFIEVMQSECAARRDAAMMTVSYDCAPRVFLTAAGMTLIRILLSDMGIQFYRMTVTEAPKFQELGNKFYDCGPGMVQDAFIPYFEAAEARNELTIPDKALATGQFCELCKASLHPLRSMGLRTDFSDEEMAYVVSEAVEMFLARYGTDKAG